MADLIDRQKLILKLEKTPIRLAADKVKMFQMIESAPTVDAVVLPCKIGDDVYIIVNLKGGKPSHITERKCTGIHITEKVSRRVREKASYYLVTNSDIGYAQHIPFTQFGKTVFFNREEAEAALAERVKNNG